MVQNERETKMHKRSRMAGSLSALMVGFGLLASAAAQAAVTVPLPAPLAGGPGNVFYGAVNAAANKNSPVVLFVHGLGSNAEYWFTNGNTMYEYVYNAGYRSVYVSMNADNSQNTAPIAQNAATLQALLPGILAHFNTQQVYLVCHSKGGLDAEVAMESPSFRAAIKAVFTLATPNQGTALADWAFGSGQKLAGLLGLLNPGLYDLEPEHVASLRAVLDPLFQTAGIPFFYMEGTQYSGQQSIVYGITGPILANLTNGEKNDGLVAQNEVDLPDSYSEDMGPVNVDHTQMGFGVNVWPYVYGRISGLEIRQAGWQQIANGGFGDDQNTWAWSQTWFQGNLYVGTGRNVDCITADDAAVQSGLPIYPPPGNEDCPQDPLHIATPAEIWRYTPQTKTWTRVYQSPQDIPLGNDENGNPAFAARAVGFRNMGVYTEADGTQALYVGGVTAISIYNKLPQYANYTYPPPIMVRSTDGTNFTEIPEDPGTTLGDIVQDNTDIFVASFRSIVQANGQMWVAVTDFRGEGFIMTSTNPSQGDNAFTRVSPQPALPNFAVWVLAAYNNAVYVGTGDRTDDIGYGIYKTTNMPGDPIPYQFDPVVLNGGYQTVESQRSPTLLTMHVWTQPDDGLQHLWCGTDRKIEIVRVNPDDSWDVIVGQPRQTPDGYKTPLSGIAYYFDNDFTGHVWQIQDSPNSGIHASTWDWSIQLRESALISQPDTGEQGFDFFNSPDGIHWYIISKNGMGDGFNFGGRSGNFNHFGLFWGTARVTGGLQEYQDPTILDLNNDGKISQADADIIQAALGQPANPGFDPRDMNGNGVIDAQDVQFLQSQCTFPNCSEVAPPGTVYNTPPAAFQGYLTAGTQLAVGNTVVLTWPAQPNASRYHVYRYTATPIVPYLLDGAPSQTINVSQSMALNFPADFTSGKLSAACPPGENDLWFCQLIDLAQTASQAPAATGNLTFVGFPEVLEEIAQTTSLSFSSPMPTTIQSIYFVRSEDGNGNLSATSNIVGAPSFTQVDQSQF